MVWKMGTYKTATAGGLALAAPLELDAMTCKLWVGKGSEGSAPLSSSMVGET